MSNSPISQALADDRSLVDRCLAGNLDAWSEIYQLHHDRLLSAIRSLTLGTNTNVELVDEIAARVWYAVVSNDAKLLSRFDPQRGCRLIAFLTGIAKFETLNFFRSERRRKRREEFVSKTVDQQFASQWNQRLEIDDFKKVLTPGERRFLECELGSKLGFKNPIPPRDLSDANRWQLRSRIQKKLKSYSKDDWQ